MELLEYNNLTKLLNKDIKNLMPLQLEIPYIYKIYSRDITIDGKKVYKIKVAGRDSYCIKQNC
jgi:hypothetical protein